MSTSSPSKQVRLIDLPVPLLCRILSFLGDDERCPSLDVSLLYAGYLRFPLRKDLLAVASASPHLASVVAHVLGPRGAYLSYHTAGRDLPQWITALGPSVKAVSSRDFVLESLNADAIYLRGTEYDHFSPSQFLKHRSYATLYVETANLLRAISADAVKLEVLDLGSVPFHRCKNREDDLLLGLYMALEHNGSSIRELALPIDRLCSTALQMATLKRLDVLEMKVPLELFVARRMRKTDFELLRQALEDMLRAVDGHADRRRNVSTLRELRMLFCFHWDNGYGFPMKFQPSRVFSVIQTLRISNMGFMSCPFFEESLICRFPNLTSLYWAGLVETGGIQHILKKCKKLQSIHLCSYETLSSERASTFWTNLPPIEEVTVLCGEKLKSVTASYPCEWNAFRVLGQKSLQLECLSLPLERANMRDCEKLLERRCRQIHRLELKVPLFVSDELWEAIRAVVLCASDALREVLITPDSFYISNEIGTKTVTRCLVDMLKFLGDRVRLFTCILPTIEPPIDKAMDAVSRILQVCAIHTRNLEVLILRYPCSKRQCRGTEESFQSLWRSREELLSALPNLYHLDLGRLGNFAKTLSLP